ncbi:MAG: type IV pili methyl-accepting chemotaxis transducer N-terminal domain-containing protein [Cellvibrionaceae bacterium]
MKLLQKSPNNSVMSIITYSLVAILSVSMLAILMSIWQMEHAEHDAQAINKSGSMRMLTYRAALHLEQKNYAALAATIELLDKTWEDSSFKSQIAGRNNQDLYNQFSAVYRYWEGTLKPAFIHAQEIQNGNFSQVELEQQIILIDKLVFKFQQDAESKITSLRMIQLIAMFTTIIIASIIFYLLKNRVEKPLEHLTNSAREIGKGDFDQHVDIENDDELGLLAKTLNQTCQSLADIHGDLENRIKEKTHRLQQQNNILQFLFDTSRKTLESPSNSLDHQFVINRLTEMMDVEHIQLCLFAPEGSLPYQKVLSRDAGPHCEQKACDTCIDEEKPYHYKMESGDTKYGLISVQPKAGESLKPWQEKLAQSTADLLTVGHSLLKQSEQDRRLTLMSERTVIARELHDSLAQSLSYLQIQVTRLQKQLGEDATQKEQSILDELREGLQSAYQSLRELLTTFRLKAVEEGLQASLEETVKELTARTQIDISLNYKLLNIPLNPQEEIHLLQIVREASQNALKHAKCDSLKISLTQMENNDLELIVEDNGVGLPDNPEKINHYGMVIMQERSRQIGGNLTFEAVEPHGTRVHFIFTPQVLQPYEVKAASGE